jgi:hypothetical protein
MQQQGIDGDMARANIEDTEGMRRRQLEAREDVVEAGISSVLKLMRNRFSSVPVSYLQCQRVPVGGTYCRTQPVASQLHVEVEVRLEQGCRECAQGRGVREVDTGFVAIVAQAECQSRMRGFGWCTFCLVRAPATSALPNR